MLCKGHQKVLVGSYDLILFEKGHYVGANAGCSYGMASPITIGINIACFVWHPWVDGNRENFARR